MLAVAHRAHISAPPCKLSLLLPACCAALQAEEGLQPDVWFQLAAAVEKREALNDQEGNMMLSDQSFSEGGYSDYESEGAWSDDQSEGGTSDSDTSESEDKGDGSG